MGPWILSFDVSQILSNPGHLSPLPVGFGWVAQAPLVAAPLGGRLRTTLFGIIEHEQILVNIVQEHFSVRLLLSSEYYYLLLFIST